MSSLNSSSSSAIDSFRRQFLELASARHGQEPSWLSLLRREAFERFLDRGFPTTSDEDWRFTSVAPLSSLEFSLESVASRERASSLLKAHLGGDWKRHEIVFVNGRFSKELSAVGELPPGVIVANLASALESHPEEVEAVLSLGPSEGASAFSDLNRALLADGAFVLVPEGVVVEKPIHIAHVSTSEKPAASHPHHIVLVERGGELRLVESYLGDDGASYLTNAAAAIVAAGGANVDHYRIQREGRSAFHIGSERLLQAGGAALQNYSLSLGARLSRIDIASLLDGEGADLTLNGLYVVTGRQHVDHHTVIDHKKPQGTSRELYKGVLDDASSGVFNGRIIVRPGAQKTNAQQTNKNLLLSEEALVNTNPQLEIGADDVKCGHGATIGQLDKDALFYLRSRGIGLAEATAILTRGFIADVSERVRIPSVRDAIRRFVLAEAA
ncbi:MAG TPA: Fe-S cluster assembly protein SufD [Vicinamibacteria bacterium]|jgi:Fe-S cluster assembly protein SufD